MGRPIQACCVIVACIFIGGCEHYQQRPLDSGAIVLAVDVARQTPIDGPLTFSSVAEFAFLHSPVLTEARAEYTSALALASVKTPLSNPSIEFGPRFGFGPDVLRRRVEPFGSIGFTIPTGKRRKRQDELNCISAEMARIEYIAKHRETYLALRKAYTELTLSRTRLTARRSVIDSATQTLELNKKAVDAGQLTALDKILFELEAGRIKGDALDAQFDIANAEASLADLTGIHSNSFKRLPENAVPQIPDAVPLMPELKRILTDNHLELARLRMKYEVAEAELRLEIAKQYPDFKFGQSAEGDISDRKTLLGLTLGIDVPIFDRNQQAIASAKGKRDEIRCKYEAAANRALSNLDRAWRGVQLASEKLTFLRAELLPKAQQSVELSRKALDAGITDSFRVLENQRAQRAITLSIVDAELTLRRAWVELEQAVGYPLMLFPEEKKDALPALLAPVSDSAYPVEALEKPVEVQK